MTTTPRGRQAISATSATGPRPWSLAVRGDCKGYYSFDLGAWHIVALNSEVPSHAGTEQEQWLRANLAAHPANAPLPSGIAGGSARVGTASEGRKVFGKHCTTTGATSCCPGTITSTRGLRRSIPRLNRTLRTVSASSLLAQAGTTTLISGPSSPPVKIRDNEAWGVLKLTLHPDSYDWEFLPIPGQTFTDKGSAPCSTPKNPPVYILWRLRMLEKRSCLFQRPALRPILRRVSPPRVSTTRSGLVTHWEPFGVCYGLDWSVLAVLQMGLMPTPSWRSAR